MSKKQNRLTETERARVLLADVLLAAARVKGFHLDDHSLKTAREALLKACQTLSQHLTHNMPRNNESQMIAEELHRCEELL